MMNGFTYQLSDSNSQTPPSNPLHASFSSVSKAESSSLSQTASVTTGTRSSTHSAEELKMAMNRPSNSSGRRVFKETRHPVYHGVRLRKNNKWVCEVRVPNKTTRIWLGTYPTADMAARAHDVAACALRGKHACLNFADSEWRLPVPASNDHLDIRRAAAEAAEAFRPGKFGGVLKSLADNEKEHESETVVMDNEIDNSYERVHENERVVMDRENVNDGLYEDEEALFNMPGLLTSMAEGLLLSPPHYYLDGVNDADHDMDAERYFSLWSF